MTPVVQGPPAIETPPALDPREHPVVRLWRPTFVVWLTLGVVGFAVLVALWMYWLNGALLPYVG